MKTLIVVPTFNEAEGIRSFLEHLLRTVPLVDILVVDDGSPDGTGRLVQDVCSRETRVHLLERTKKDGLGRAYLAGFAWGFQKGFEVLVQMDSDFSHRPEDLNSILKRLSEPEVDFVVGSRYVRGGGTQNWSFLRKLISRGGGLYASLLLGFGFSDWTGGFNAWKRRTLEGLGLSKVTSEGYCFQIELKYRAWKKGFRGAEVPILFEERRAGQSKMSGRIVQEAVLQVLKLRSRV